MQRVNSQSSFFDGLRNPPTLNSKKHQHTISLTASSDDSIYLPIEYISITGHKFSFAKLVTFYVISIISVGILPIICKHKINIWTFLAREPTKSFRDADFVLVQNKDGTFEEIQVQRIKARMNLSSAGGAKAGPTGIWDGVVNDDGVVIIAGQGEEIERIFSYFEYRKQRYVFREGSASFLRMNTQLSGKFDEIHNYRHGMSGAEAIALLERNGPNLIEIDSVPILQMLFDKILHPFYLFQIFSIIIWSYEYYYVYALVIGITSSISVIWEIFIAKSNEGALREIFEIDQTCIVIRDGEEVEINAQHLVLGDAVVIQELGTIAADMILVQGECVVDESSLTGESLPVVKTALGIFDNKGESYMASKCRKNILFCGSKIMELKPMLYAVPDDNPQSKIIGIVSSTGFNSAKGELFRSILFPNKIDFKFYRDSWKFIGTLGVVALVAFINRMINGINSGYNSLWVIITSLDLITITVPPALPLVLTVGISMALKRLKTKNIFCIAPDRINFAGRVNVFCWDKTGTLTVPNVTWSGLERCKNGNLKGFANNLRANGDGELEKAIASCHSLAEINGELIGSPIEKELFLASGWRLSQQNFSISLNGHTIPVLAKISKPIIHAPTPQCTPVDGAFPIVNLPTDSNFLSPAIIEPPNLKNAVDDLYILKRFEFDAHIQRSTVIFKPTTGSVLFASCKGSPESIRNICRPSSIPSNYHEAHSYHAANGCYVLAVAIKSLETVLPKSFSMECLTNCRRERVERDMKFLGFVLLNNPLKSESKATISMMKEAKIESLIITGDSSMTAINVGRELNICNDVLLVDMYERSVGFRRLKYDQEKPTLSSTSLHKEKDSNLSRRQHRSITISTDKANMKILTDTTHEDFTSLITSKLSKSKHLSKLGQSASCDNISKNSPISLIHDQNQPKTYPIEELERVYASMPENSTIALTGSALDYFLMASTNDSFLQWVIHSSKIFARMKPNHKTFIVETLIKSGKYVGMCGDGANDSGALKAAHIGLALSDSEASIVAPFTSAKRLVSDVPKLLSEGRCALDTSFIAFKFMFMYPIIQLAMTATLNQMGSGLSNNQFLFDDMAVVLVLGILMLKSEPARIMSPTRPTDNLFSPYIIISILGQIFIIMAFFCMNYLSLTEQTWFCPVSVAKSGLDMDWNPINKSAPNNITYPCYYIDPVNDVNANLLIKSQENTGIWLFSHIQFAIISLAFVISSPHRRALYTNVGFLLYWIIIFAILTLMLLCVDSQIGFREFANIFSIREGVQYDYRLASLFMICTNLALCITWEVAVVNVLFKRLVARQDQREEERLEQKWKKMINEGDTLMSRLDGGKSNVIKMSERLDMSAAMRVAKSWSDMSLDEESRIISSHRERKLGRSIEMLNDQEESLLKPANYTRRLSE